MKYSLTAHADPLTDTSDCIIIPVFLQDDKPILGQATQAVDTASQGKIQSLLDQGDFNAKAGETCFLYQLKNIMASRVLLLGCGNSDNKSVKEIQTIMKACSKALKNSNTQQASLYFTDDVDASAQTIIQIITTFEDSLYDFQDYKSKPKNAITLSDLTLCSSNASDHATEIALAQGVAIAKGMKLTRDLANHPGNVCTPSFLAETAETLANDFDTIQLNVLEESDMQELGMGSFLSVSKGSDEPGKMIVLQYQGADASEAPIALVGKGVTFDSGGISLKPGGKMDEMKFDMGGAAGMIGTLKACAEMALSVNLVVVLAAAENMPSARASKPGDIVTSMQGTTIEVLNTDAEGRLVLCDALTYVGKFKPRIVIDAATLTGACIVALGHHIGAVLSNDDTLAQDLIQAGNTINDPVWQLPMNDDYKKQLKSACADLGNIGGPAAGTITAACFLGEFTKDYTWAHLDIAGVAWSGKNATGRPVPLLSQYLINQANAV